VNWVLDADIRSYFDSIDRTWMIRFLKTPDCGQQAPAVDPEVDERGGR
jgi:hypothetical protein